MGAFDSRESPITITWPRFSWLGCLLEPSSQTLVGFEGTESVLELQILR